MNDTIREQLSAWLDGELSETERAEAAARLDADADCRAYLAELTALHEFLSEPEEIEVPSNFAAGVLDRLHKENEQKTVDLTKPAPRRLWKGLAALAACAAVAVLAVRSLPRMGSSGGAAPASGASSAVYSAPASAEDAAGAEEYGYDAGAAPEAPMAAMAAPDGGTAGTETNAAAKAAAPEAADLRAAVTEQSAPEAAAEDRYLPYPERLTLRGEGAADWLRENGTPAGEEGGYFVPLEALARLPEGLTLDGGDAPERIGETGVDTVLVYAETEATP